MIKTLQSESHILSTLNNSVLARPKRQGAAPYRFSVRPVVFLQSPVVFVILHIVLIKIWDKKNNILRFPGNIFQVIFNTIRTIAIAQK